jgi:hypothetical protein
VGLAGRPTSRPSRFGWGDGSADFAFDHANPTTNIPTGAACRAGWASGSLWQGHSGSGRWVDGGRDVSGQGDDGGST